MFKRRLRSERAYAEGGIGYNPCPQGVSVLAWGMPQSFEDAVDTIISMHPEYSPDAYSYMRSSLDSAARRFGKTPDNPHLTAEELYLGFCAALLEDYGPLAKAVTEHWGIFKSADVGAIVYNLIEVGVFGRQESDTQSQFDHLRPIEDVLNEPYLIAPKKH